MTDPKEDVLKGLEGYTPGPWKTTLKPTSIGHVHSFEPIGGCIYVDDSGVEWRPEPEATNNARLIARAPELVDEIRALRAFIRKMLGCGSWYLSAIEIDVHEGYKGERMDGETLEAEALALLPPAERP